MNRRKETFTGKRDGPHLLITAGVHGDEFEPMVAVDRLIQQLSTCDLAGRVTLVPVVNESAFSIGKRTGSDGLDLARVCPGNDQGSATEQSAAALSQLIGQADYYIDLHTGGVGYSVWPMSGYLLHQDSAVLAKQQKMSQVFNLPVIWGTYAGNEGRSLSVARDAAVPAIYTEYLGSVPFHPEAVDALSAGCLNVMGWLEMIDREPAAGAVAWICEDDRAGAGHMQICHPAPHAGLFVADVGLGETVQQGQVLGTVTDMESGVQSTVPAQQTGRILTIHSFARVAQADGLFVVVDFQPFEESPS
jgi:predicted deacylase